MLSRGIAQLMPASSGNLVIWAGEGARGLRANGRHGHGVREGPICSQKMTPTAVSGLIALACRRTARSAIAILVTITLAFMGLFSGQKRIVGVTQKPPSIPRSSTSSATSRGTKTMS